MTKRIAINGYGRIGRCVLRSIFELGYQHDLTVVAINDTAGIESTAYSTRYDSTHGRFPYQVSVEGDRLCIDNQLIQVTSARDPLSLPWQALAIDLVFECTGHFTARQDAAKHLDAGAKQVLISAPSSDADATIVYGVNHETLVRDHVVVSAASCTTNCLAPVVKPLHEAFGIESGILNTIHAYTKDQSLLDGHHRDFRRARAAAHSIIPTKTGAAQAVSLVLPELAGKLDGFAMRVPTQNVSVIDLTFISQKQTTVDEVNRVMYAAKSDVLHVSSEPLVSCDFNHHVASAIFDSTQTRVLGSLVKVVAWYDNEWGFANRMLDTALHMMSL